MVTNRLVVERVEPPKGPYRVVNPVLRWILSSPRRAGRIGEQLLILHLVGRKTGRQLDVPVAYHAADGRLRVLTNSGWRVNLRGHPDVEVTLRGHRQPATAELVEDPVQVAAVYRELIEQIGVGKSTRRIGVRVHGDRLPTLEDVTESARLQHLSVVYLTVALREGSTA